MSEFDKFLDDVGEEIRVKLINELSMDRHVSELDKDAAKILKRRLLGLLEAGEKCARAHGVAMENEFSCSSEEEEAWDAAKQAAMEGRS